MKRVRDYYDQVSRAYDSSRADRYHELADRIAVQEVLRAWDGVGLVIEAGCGTGRVLERMHRTGVPVLGVDLSMGMLEAALARGLPVVQGDVTRLPVADGCASVACSFKVLPHVQDLEAALEAMAGVVRPGGRVVVEVYNPLSLRGLVKKLWAGAIVDGVRESEVFTRFDTVADLEAAACRVGLVLERTRGYRVVTPAARAMDLPVLGRLLEFVETALSVPAARLAGFVIVTFGKPEGRPMRARA